MKNTYIFNVKQLPPESLVDFSLFGKNKYDEVTHTHCNLPTDKPFLADYSATDKKQVF